jgi:hypothetical protein
MTPAAQAMYTRHLYARFEHAIRRRCFSRMQQSIALAEYVEALTFRDLRNLGLADQAITIRRRVELECAAP